jgi:hypothetical protein
MIVSLSCSSSITEYRTAFSAVDATQLASELPPVPKLCNHESCDGCWKGYPQSRFPNWTEDQVARSMISNAITNYCRTEPCVTYRADIRSDGIFVNVESVLATDADIDATWDMMINAVVRSLLRVCCWIPCSLARIALGSQLRTSFLTQFNFFWFGISRSLLT